MHACLQARIITKMESPNHVVYANQAWEQLCGYTCQEVLGKEGLKFLQGEATDRLTLQKIKQAVQQGSRVRVNLINYKKDGTAFLNRLQISPLQSRPGEATHLLGVLSDMSLQH